MNILKRMFAILFICAIPFLAQAKVDKLRCMWRTDPATTMVIGWNQISGSNPEICYGEFDGGSDSNFYPSCAQPARSVYFKGMNNHFVRLEHLRPDTKYFFIVVDSEGTSRRYSFKTTPADSDTRLSIVAGGDSRNYRNARQRANQMVAKLRPDFVMFGGDMTGGDSDKEWREWMDDWQMTISSEGHLTPIVATRGNHEYSNRTIADLFDVPSRNIYYRLSFCNNLLDVFTLNSLMASGGNQKAWLEENLKEANNSIWKMAQYHYAIRPHTARKTERNDQLFNWAKLFQTHKMNLVVESDAHCVKTTWPIRPSKEAGSEQGFIRDDNNGTVYVGEGCWGAPIRKNNDDKSWTRNSGSFNQFKWVFVDPLGIEVRTVKTDNAAQVASVGAYDRFNPPAGIDIWNPSHGPVLRISNRSRNLVNTNPATFNYSDMTKRRLEIIQPQAEAVEEGIKLTWVAKNPDYIRNSFLVQRMKTDGKFETLAKVEGTNAEQANFSIMDIGASLEEESEYRLVCSSPGHKSSVTNLVLNKPSLPLAKAVASSTTQVLEQKSPQEFTKREIRNANELSPDLKSGYLRVKYSLGKQSDVSIELLRAANKMSSSRYQNQREGNYLKSIDMSEMPQGDYQLIIKVDQEVLHEYSVKK